MKEYTLKGGPEAGRVVEMDPDSPLTAWSEISLEANLTVHYKLQEGELVYEGATVVHAFEGIK